MVMLDSDADEVGVEDDNFDTHMDRLRARIAHGAATDADAAAKEDGELAKKLKRDLFDMLDDHDSAKKDNLGCNPAADPAVGIGGPMEMVDPLCGDRMYPATAGKADQTVDPSFFQVAVSYAFGDTSVGVSWYQSNDKYNDGSQLVAIGAGVDHNLPKLGTNVYVALQNYSVEDDAASIDSDDTVVMIGARVKF